MPIMKPAEMPKPVAQSAFMDNNKRIWLWEPDPPSKTGKWRLPGGLLVKPGNPVLEVALINLKVTRFRRMAPVRVRRDSWTAPLGSIE